MKKFLNVLNIEDSEQDAALLTRHLKHAGYDLRSARVQTPAAMKDALETQAWDVILSDYSMPRFGALDALATLKKTGLEIPFIIISGAIGESVAVEAMLAGADDYLMKDNLARLVPAIERGLQMAENRRARQQAEAALRESEDRYRDLVENSNDLICTHDLEGRILSVNQAAVKLLGYDRATLLSKNFRDILFSGFRTEFDNYIAELSADGISQGLMSVQTRTGERRILEYINTLRTEGVSTPIVRGIAHDMTEQKRTEAALRKSEAQYRRLLETTFEGVWIFDAELRTTYANQRLAEMLGVNMEMMIGRPAYDFLDNDARADVERRWQQRAVGFTDQYDLRLRRADGSELWAIACATPIFDERGNFVGSLSMLTDITERVRAEEALKASESELRALFAAMTDMILVLDAEGRYVKVAPTAPPYLFKPADSLIGKRLDEVFPKEQADFFLDHIRHALDEGRMHRVEYNLELEGAGVWFDGSISPMTEDSVLWIARDITERKQADEALRDSEERYRHMFENNPHVMWVYDMETLRFLAVNDTAVQHYGYSHEEFLTMTIKDIRPPDDIPALLDNISQVGEGLDQAGIWRHQKKDGTIIGVEIISHFLNFAGRRAEMVLVNDVTERRQLEEQLRQSQKMEAVGRLAGGVAHDFNNLLTAINGYSDLLLRRQQIEDSSRNYLEEIKKAGGRAASLTRQLLAFSRKQVLQPEILDLNAVVSDLERMLRRLIGEDIELLTTLGPGLGQIKADPGQIEQVIMNLIVNARDAMPQGGKLIIETRNLFLDEEEAKHHVSVNPGHYVVLTVSDTGIGMDEKIQAHIFEPFFTTKEAGKGTGLGLSTAYGIIKQSDGHILVSSEVGQGTTFEIYLPMVGGTARKSERVSEHEEIFQGTETILLVEDEDVVRNLARQALEMYGYQILEANGGKAAISICERHAEPIQLLITDVVMPGMSGRELAEHLSPLRREMKVLFMSGYTDDAIVHQGVLEREANFIQKPFSLDGLAQKVREVLDKN